MILKMPTNLAARYKSPAQRARVVTEGWAERNLFCPSCPANRVSPLPPNSRAVDFECNRCAHRFQLKGKSSPITSKVIDGAYDTLMTALNSDTVPSLLLLEYDRTAWTVVNLTLIPYFAFSPSAIEKRTPLSATAHRAGWVGCFIVLSRIPVDARIGVVRSGEPVEPESVRAQYKRLLPLKRMDPPKRAWTLDVLSAVRRLGKPDFTNADIYAQSGELRARHPENRHVADKIRQQLQILRDSGFLDHVGRGRWRLV